MTGILRASIAAAVCVLLGSWGVSPSQAQQSETSAHKRARFAAMIAGNSMQEMVGVRRAAATAGTAGANVLGVSALRQERAVNALVSTGQRNIVREEQISAGSGGSWSLARRFAHLSSALRLANALEANNPTAADALRMEAENRFNVLYGTIKTQLSALESKSLSVEEQIAALQAMPQTPAIARQIRLLQAQLRAVAARENALTRLLTQSTPDRPSGA